MFNTLSLTAVKKKIALAIRNNYLNSNLNIIQFANKYNIYEIGILAEIVEVQSSQSTGYWDAISIEKYLEISSKLGISVTFTTHITREIK